MKKTLYFEVGTDEEQKENDEKWMKKSLKYARREKWEGLENDILKLAEKRGIDLRRRNNAK